MMKLSTEVAPYLPDVEIIELHHNNKLDAPSGTAIMTADKIEAARKAAGAKPAPDKTHESLDAPAVPLSPGSLSTASACRVTSHISKSYLGGTANC